MELKRFRVTNFRSVEDSGWIETQRVAALIGVNESGKTNLLIPLWKLNPAREGDIRPTSDYPKKLFGTIRAEPDAYKFIVAEFELEDTLTQQIANQSGYTADVLKRVQVERYFGGSYYVDFPDATPKRTVAPSELMQVISDTETTLVGLNELAKEEGLKAQISETLKSAKNDLASEPIPAPVIKTLRTTLEKSLPTEPVKTSTITPRIRQLIEQLEAIEASLQKPSPGEIEAVHDLVIDAMPKFVYYSNYGNLDSEIYLPHVVQNLKRTDLGAKEAAKARTLRVLFRFVRLSPEEILELGQDFKDPQHPNREPKPDEIAAIAEKKRERSILLQSAGTLLTSRFKEWWKQGDYRFRFEADGNHFRIWVSDDRRPEEVELESRSTGLQWFLSFYLVFLVESEAAHRNAILLLDEPGLSLHPLAQRNLSSFFDGLAKTNQIIYTTHSPFLVDADHLDRVRKVYVAPDGTTKATEDLRHGASDGIQAGAAYAVHSALNLSVAESLLLGCQPVIVEGPSDQHYLTTIKALLIGAGKFAPKRELIFPPSGGVKTARMIAGILTGRDESLPIILLDADEAGRKTAKELQTALYAEAPDRVLTVDTFTGIPGSEIEDLFPGDFIAKVIDRWQREPEETFSDVFEQGKPIINQITAWAAKNNLRLDRGWKVELAKRTKQYALDRGISSFDSNTADRWMKLFEAFAQTA